MNRENATQYMKIGNTLFVPKNGGLNDYIQQLLPRIGINPEEQTSNLKVISTRGEDIPKKIFELAQQGITAYGITGDDLFDEFRLSTPWAGLKVINTYDWYDPNAKFFRPALCVLNKTGKIEDLPKNPLIGINKKYQKQSTDYIDKVLELKGFGYKILIYSGDLERNIDLGINDCVIDIVYTGKSLAQQGLGIADIVRFSDIVLIGPSEKSVFETEYERIRMRVKTPTESYTSKLLRSDNEIVKKFGQETAEFVQAFATTNNLVGESLDVLYAVMLALAKRETPWEEVEQTLIKRWG